MVAARGRRAAEALMSDHFDIYRTGARMAQDEVTGLEHNSLAWSSETHGKVQGPSTQASDTATRTVNVGGVERPVIVAGLHVPVCADVVIGDELVCTHTGPGSPEGLVNRRWLVVNVPMKSYMTALRLDVVEVANPVVVAVVIT